MRRALVYAAKWGLVALFAALLCAPSFAQTSNGTLAGVVIDPTGAAVTNATVTIKANNTGDTKSITTNAVGAYRFESLLPGTYTMTVTAPSFATTTVQAINVVASTITSINPTLKLGGSSQTVTVEASAEALQTESGEVSSTISTSEVTNLPIGSLNPYELATTLPGVVSGAATNFGNGQTFSVNGVRSRSNNFLIEGQDNNDAALHGQGLQIINPEAVKEVSVQTNAYAAEFGHGGGSVSNAIFKSGANDFHGSLWELYQGSSLNANDHWNNLMDYPKSPWHENTFGWSLSGPVKKDKAFFFASYQWDKYRSSTQSGTLSVPTADGFAALQSLLATSNANQKKQINTLLQAYGSLRGVNNTQTINLPVDPYTGAVRPGIQIGNVVRQGIPANSDSPELDLKGDYLITPNDTLSLRYIKSNNTSPYDLFNNPYQLPGFDTMQYGSAHNAGITYTHIFSPKVINELRLSYGRIGFFFDYRPETWANPLVDNGNMPAVSISKLTGWGPPSGDPQSRFHNTYQLQDSVSWIKGNHSFKFGFDASDIRVVDMIPFSDYYGAISYADSNCPNTKTTDPCYGGTALKIAGLANYIDGFGGAGAVSRTFGSNMVRSPLANYNFFGQDAWKLRPNLTLTYGLRYEYNVAAANDLPYPAIDPKNPMPTEYPVRIKQQADTTNFGPRVGFAYTPRFAKSIFGENKTVIRGGAGFFYDQLFTNILDNNQSGAPNTVPAVVSSNVSAANPRGLANWYYNTQSPALNPVLSPYATVFTIYNNMKNPETYQWNFNLQRELPGAFTLTAGYVGTRGLYLYGNNHLNPADPEYAFASRSYMNAHCGGQACRLNQSRGMVIVRDNSGDSNYHALQVSLDRKMSHGLELRTNYTWSKTIDDSSEVFTTGNYSSYPLVELAPRGLYDRSVSALDRRHRLVITYVYNLPKFKAPGLKENPVFAVMGQALNGWSISGTTTFQSGAPGNVFAGYDVNGDGVSNDRPMLSNPQAPITSWGVMDYDANGNPALCNGPMWYYTYKPCQVIDPSSVRWIVGEYLTQISNPVGRNYYRAPGSQSFNISLAKTFKLTERQSLQFRTDFYNPFNHANTGVPNLTLASGSGLPAGYNDGQVSQPWSYVPTLGDLSQTIGGNRSIRLWLKYSF